jgi:hypothetical protein
MVTVLAHGGGVVVVQDGHERVLSEPNAVNELAMLPEVCDSTTTLVYGLKADRGSLERALALRGRSFFYLDTGYREERLRYRIDHPTPELAGFDLARIPMPVAHVVGQVLDSELGLSPKELASANAARVAAKRRWREGPAYRGIAVRYRYTQGALQVLVPAPVQSAQPGNGNHQPIYGVSPALVLIPQSALPVITETDYEHPIQPLAPQPGIEIGDGGNI